MLITIRSPRERRYARHSRPTKNEDTLDRRVPMRLVREKDQVTPRISII